MVRRVFNTDTVTPFLATIVIGYHRFGDRDDHIRTFTPEPDLGLQLCASSLSTGVAFLVLAPLTLIKGCYSEIDMLGKAKYTP
jgi:hypothetical protein